MDSQKLRARMDTAVDIARAAGETALTYFRKSDLSVDMKENGTPVSAADRAAEALIRKRILEQYPDEGIIGEEEGADGNLKKVWIVDPIDGTESFVRGVPLFGTLIAYEEAGVVSVGVIHMPALGETVFAARGLGAWWISGEGVEPVPAKVSDTSDLGEAMLNYTSLSYFEKANCEASLSRLVADTKDSRGWSDCYGHLLAATGRVDIAVDPVMEIWDCAPLQCILEEAGGAFTTLKGSKSIREGSTISTNKKLIDQVLPYFID